MQLIKYSQKMFGKRKKWTYPKNKGIVSYFTTKMMFRVMIYEVVLE